MLSVLRIKNFAIIEDLELEFADGFTVLTGETGAGKSIILKAIDLLSGRRASGDLIRSGAERLEVEALFLIPSERLEDLRSHLDDLADVVDEELLIRRVIDRNGRSKISVNGSLITAAFAGRLAIELFDIVGQHQHQRLLDEGFHSKLLDDFGAHRPLLDEVERAAHEYFAAKKLLENFDEEQRLRLSQIEFLRSEVQELSEIDLKKGERTALEAEVARLSHTETLADTANQIVELFEGEDRGIEMLLRKCRIGLERVSGFDPRIEPIVESANSLCALAEDLRATLVDYGSGLEGDPLRVEELRSRVADIARLERKYNRSGDELVAFYAERSQRLEALESANLSRDELAGRVKSLLATLTKHCKSLTAARKKAALSLATGVKTALIEVGMPKAEFFVDQQAIEPSSNGAEKIVFLIAANPGEPPRSIAKVASGGELSRLLLILSTLLNETRGPLLQVFDEIDVGVGGAIAQALAEKLTRLSERCQVVAITHSPQVAAFAERHLLISKHSTDSITRTAVQILSSDERVGVVARMLAGKKLSANFEQSARELLDTAQQMGSQ